MQGEMQTRANDEKRTELSSKNLVSFLYPPLPGPVPQCLKSGL